MHELAAWLLDEIEATTELERLNMIGETIAYDKSINAEYLANPQVLKILRRAWGEKKAELAIDIESNVGEIDCVAVQATQTNDSSGKPA